MIGSIRELRTLIPLFLFLGLCMFSSILSIGGVILLPNIQMLDYMSLTILESLDYGLTGRVMR